MQVHEPWPGWPCSRCKSTKGARRHDCMTHDSCSQFVFVCLSATFLSFRGPRAESGVHPTYALSPDQRGVQVQVSESESESVPFTARYHDEGGTHFNDSLLESSTQYFFLGRLFRVVESSSLNHFNVRGHRPQGRSR